MGLSLLNTTDFGPKHQKLCDIYSGGSDMDIYMILTSGAVKFEIDGSTINPEFYSSNGLNRHLGDVEDRTISVYKGASSGGKSITTFNASSEDIVGVLDISSLVGLDSLAITNCADISTIIFPSYSRGYSSQIYLGSNTNLQGTLDLSGLSNLGGTVQIFGNSNLEEVKFGSLDNPDASIVDLSLRQNNLIGTLDISSLTTISGNVWIYDNPNLTNIIWPSTTNEVDNVSIYQNNLSIVDISSLKFSTSTLCTFNANNNSNATKLIFPETSANWTNITAYNNNYDEIVNLTGLTGDIAAITLRLNNLSGNFVLADSSAPITTFNISSNNFNSIDVSNRFFNNTNFNVSNNHICSQLILPDSSCVFSGFYAGFLSLSGLFDISNHYFTGTFNMYDNDISTLLWDPDKMVDLVELVLYSNYNLSGVLDVSNMINLTSIKLANCSNITSLLLPSGNAMSTFDVGGINLYEDTLDISMWTKINKLSIGGNDVSTILWPSDLSAEDLLQISVPNCNFSVIDVSMFNQISGALYLYNNPNLTTIRLPELGTKAGSYCYFRVENCNLQGTLDLSTFRDGYYSFDGYGNSLLENVIWPSSMAKPFGVARWHDCSLNQTSVDGLLSLLSNFYSSTSPTLNLNVSLGGGNNATPTDGSLNVDISTLEYYFGLAGKTLTITYNP